MGWGGVTAHQEIHGVWGGKEGSQCPRWPYSPHPQTRPPCHCTGSLSGTGRHQDGSPLLFNTWHTCSSPWTYSVLQSGIYAFSVRAVDNAGNTGLGTSPLTFTVDASLPVNGTNAVSSTGSDSSGVNVLIVGVLAGPLWPLIVAGCWV